MAKKYAKNFSTGEVMAAFLAHDLKDEEYGLTGAVSMIPWLACKLAQSTHAPGLWYQNNAHNVALSWAGSFAASPYTFVEHRGGLGADLMDAQGTSRDIDFAFYGGFQIDKHGNINMAFIGDQKKPKFRGPGSVGVMATAMLKRIYIFTDRHDPRLLVEKADFISGPGFGDGSPGWREKNGIPSYSEGPRYCVTPLCIFDFDEKTHIMRIKSVHPGKTVEEVKQRTGFAPVIPANVPVTEPPTEEEHEIMMKLDPEGIVRNIVP